MDVQPWLKILMAALLFFFFSYQTHASEETAGPFPPENLRCEYLENPTGIDVEKPRFSWMLKHSERGQKQTAYQLIVCTDPLAESADVWD